MRLGMKMARAGPGRAQETSVRKSSRCGMTKAIDSMGTEGGGGGAREARMEREGVCVRWLGYVLQRRRIHYMMMIFFFVGHTLVAGCAETVAVAYPIRRQKPVSKSILSYRIY